MAALSFAEHGITVSLNDSSEDAISDLLKTAEGDGIFDKWEKRLDHPDLCENLDKLELFVFSMPHSTVGDGVVDGLHPYLEESDLIIDASNENQ